MEVLNIQFSDVNSDKPFGFRDKKESGVVSSKKAFIEVTQGEVKAVFFLWGLPLANIGPLDTL